MNKGYFLVGILVATLFVGCQNQSAKPTSGEAVYKSEEYGFSFSYPLSWNVTKDTDARKWGHY